MLKKILLVLTLCIGALIGFALWERHQLPPETAGGMTAARVDADWLVQQREQQRSDSEQAGADARTQILFGDLHLHSTFSMDGFAWALPAMMGEGLHPPAEACDYARYCSGLDFWAATDHAESLTPGHWNMIKSVVRQCNALSGPAGDPDLVSFLGWEWTQMGNTPQTHYGHRNVILLDTEEERVPARPIGAGGAATTAMRESGSGWLAELLLPYVSGWKNRLLSMMQVEKQRHLRSLPLCEKGVDTRELPLDCIETADTPAELREKLDQWGFESLVIPHGTTWGYYTPPGTDWRKQLEAQYYDSGRQRLVEIYSGHGNAEEYRDWRAVEFDDEGEPICPEPRDGYQPCCHRAGEIVRSRCEAPGSVDCEARVEKAKRDYLAAGRGGARTLANVEPEEWLNCGQCTDCFQPAFSHRPGNAVQYQMAVSNFGSTDETGRPLRFRYGFISSSDNHASQPGTGYKELNRHAVTETGGATNALMNRLYVQAANPGGDGRESVPFDLEKTRYNFFQVNESERQSSMFYSGGLVAVHSHGRDRNAIWQALKQRRVYGTSGPRILLWFDLIAPDGSRVPMGGESEQAQAPHFVVKAAGARRQKPGCPDRALTALGEDKIVGLCGGECYHPSDELERVERIEVIRITPQHRPDEDVGDLIEDPWRVFDCPADKPFCQVEFSDPDFADSARDALYYVRAVQRASPAINGAGLRCAAYDAGGICRKVEPCYGDYRTDRGDDCLAPVQERAWSSPIYINHPDAIAVANDRMVDTNRQSKEGIP